MNHFAVYLKPIYCKSVILPLKNITCLNQYSQGGDREQGQLGAAHHQLPGKANQSESLIDGQPETSSLLVSDSVSVKCTTTSSNSYKPP